MAMDDLIQGLPRSLKGASGGTVAAKLLARTTTRTFMPILIGLWLFFVLSGFGLSAKAENVGHDITAARVNDKV